MEQKQNIYPHIRGFVDYNRDNNIQPSQEELFALCQSYNVDPASIDIHRYAFGGDVNRDWEITYVFIDKGYSFVEEEFDKVYDETFPWYVSCRQWVAEVPQSFDMIARELKFKYSNQVYGERFWNGVDGYTFNISETTRSNWTIAVWKDAEKGSGQRYAIHAQGVALTWRDYIVFLADHGYEPAIDELAKERQYKIDFVMSE